MQGSLTLVLHGEHTAVVPGSGFIDLHAAALLVDVVSVVRSSCRVQHNSAGHHMAYEHAWSAQNWGIQNTLGMHTACAICSAFRHSIARGVDA